MALRRLSPTVVAGVRRRLAATSTDRVWRDAVKGLPGRRRVDAEVEGLHRRAAVLVPICQVGGVASLLLTVRSSHVGTHQGDASWPGGHIEKGESVEAAARREAVEELGDRLRDVEVLGHFHEYPSRAGRGTHVSTVVGLLDGDLGDLSCLAPNPAEVDEAFALPIHHVADPKHMSLEKRSWSGGTIVMPRFYGGPVEVYGLTAVIIRELLRTVLLPAFSEADGQG